MPESFSRNANYFNSHSYFRAPHEQHFYIGLSALYQLYTSADVWNIKFCILTGLVRMQSFILAPQRRDMVALPTEIDHVLVCQKAMELMGMVMSDLVWLEQTGGPCSCTQASEMTASLIEMVRQPLFMIADSEVCHLSFLKC